MSRRRDHADYIFRDGEPPPPTDTEEPPMKIQYTSVWFEQDNEVPRLDAGKGMASHSTSHFDIEKSRGITIELDTATGLVRIALGPTAVYVPREKVKRLGPTLEDAAAMKVAAATAARISAEANARATAEAEALSNQPRTP